MGIGRATKIAAGNHLRRGSAPVWPRQFCSMPLGLAVWVFGESPLSVESRPGGPGI